MRTLAVGMLCLALAGCATFQALNQDDPRTLPLDTACGLGFAPWPAAVAICGAAVLQTGVLWLFDHAPPPTVSQEPVP